MTSDGSDFRREEIVVGLSDDVLAAVAGWRDANNLPTNADAVSELVRLGLLSEISKAHEFVVAIRNAVDHEDAETAVSSRC